MVFCFAMEDSNSLERELLRAPPVAEKANKSEWQRLDLWRPSAVEGDKRLVATVQASFTMREREKYAGRGVLLLRQNKNHPFGWFFV